MLNNSLLTGNLGADPEVFYSSEGDPIATFNLAFRSSKKKTNWIKTTCFNKLAEIVEKHLHRGARIGIIGTLEQQKWETDEGAQRSSFQLIANTIEFDKGRIETGILMLTSERSEKSRLGTSIELAKAEVEQLYPTISMPVTIALFDLGTPELPDENSVKGGETDGVSVQTAKTIEEYTEEDWENFEPFP